MSNEQLKIDLRVQDEMDFDAEIKALISDTANTRLRSGVFARSKHEAYGIAAENYSQIQGTVKVLKGDIAQLLAMLPLDTTGARIVESISSIYGTAQRLAKESVILASLCGRMIDDIYSMEPDETLPLEEYGDLDGAEFDDTDDIEESEEE